MKGTDDEAEGLLFGVEGFLPVGLTNSSAISSSPPTCALTETTGVEPKVIPGPPPRTSSLGRPCKFYYEQYHQGPVSLYRFSDRFVSKTC